MESSNRKKLIREVLDYDKEINERVYNLEKKQVANWGDEEVQPLMQINDEVLAKVSEIVNNIKSLIEEKQKDATNEPLALAPVTDVLVLYNQMAQIYIEPSNTPQNRIAIKNIANSMDGRVLSIHNDIKTLLKQSTKLQSAFNFYDIVIEQLRTGNIHPISDEEFASNHRKLVRQNPSTLGERAYLTPPQAKPFESYGIHSDSDDDFDDISDMSTSGFPPPPPPPPAAEPATERARRSTSKRIVDDREESPPRRKVRSTATKKSKNKSKIPIKKKHPKKKTPKMK